VLYNIEAEEGILGYLFNKLGLEEKKLQILSILTQNHFYHEKLGLIFKAIFLYRIFDKIVLWDKVGSISTFNKEVDWEDINALDEFVTDVEADAYVQILIDKTQKRSVYYFAKHLQEEILKGSDQFQLALDAQKILMSMATKTEVETNQDLLEKVLNETSRDIIKLGYKKIDEYIGGLTRGMILTIGGDSGHMKTTLALDMSLRMAEANPGLKIGIFSKEMTSETMMKKLISRVCGIPTNLIFSQQYDKNKIKEQMLELKAFRENQIRIIKPDAFTGVHDIAKIQMTHKFDIWFLDFVQLLEFSRDSTGSSDYNVQIGQNMRSLQALALGTKTVGIVLSQVKKGVEYREIKKPTISDLEWSGLIKQLSAYILFSYYPGKYYGWQKLPDDHYYILGEKTRFARTFIYPMEVSPEVGVFREVDEVKRKIMNDKLLNVLNKVKEGGSNERYFNGGQAPSLYG
jgi:replicative DNA helicase